MFIHLCTHNARPRAWYRWGLGKGLIPTPKVNYPGWPCCSHTCGPPIKHRADVRWPVCVGVIRLPTASTQHTRRWDKPYFLLPVLISRLLRAPKGLFV